MKSSFKFIKTEPPTEAYVKTYCPHSTMDEQMILWLEREMLNYAHNYKDENGVANGMPALPDEDTERDMYHMTEKILGEAGYHRYEISNYAMEGFECLHNIGYWQ